MIVRPWEKGDTERILVQPSQEYLAGFQASVDLSGLSEAGMAWVGEHEGKVLAMAGFLPQWEGRALAWALLSKEAGPHFRAIHRAVEEKLIKSPFRRVEATVDVGFEPGHRWMKMLDFEPEGYLRAYRPDGGDQVMYARIRR